mgnify:CR=1 FL=1
MFNTLGMIKETLTICTFKEKDVKVTFETKKLIEKRESLRNKRWLDLDTMVVVTAPAIQFDDDQLSTAVPTFQIQLLIDDSTGPPTISTSSSSSPPPPTTLTLVLPTT